MEGLPSTGTNQDSVAVTEKSLKEKPYNTWPNPEIEGRSLAQQSSLLPRDEQGIPVILLK